MTEKDAKKRASLDSQLLAMQVRKVEISKTVTTKVPSKNSIKQETREL
jgi:hypothetical protein